MLIGVPKEIKTHEYRVGLVPASVRELIHHGHKVVVETKAGGGIGFNFVGERKFNICFMQLFQIFIAFPYITHNTSAVTGAVRHQYYNRQSLNTVRLQCAVALISMI